jgi:hypothetical protein
MKANLSPYPSLSNTTLDSITLIGTIRRLPSDAPETLILKHAFANSIKTIWAVMAGLAGVALIASLGVKEYEIDQQLSGDQGFMDEASAENIEVKVQSDEEGGITPPSIGEAAKRVDL